MSASKVCNGTRPSEIVSCRLISMPPRRPPHWILTPSAPLRIVLVRARFIVLRNAALPSSCSAMDSATSEASSSGRDTSRTLTCTFLLVRRSSSVLKASTSLPPLPMTMPGRAVWISTATSPCSAALRILMSAMPALLSFFSMCSRILRSSPKRSAKSLSEYQLLLLALGRVHDRQSANRGLQLHRYVAGPFADHSRPAHRPSLIALYRRSLVDLNGFDPKLVGVHIHVVLGVGGGAV